MSSMTAERTESKADKAHGGTLERCLILIPNSSDFIFKDRFLFTLWANYLHTVAGCGIRRQTSRQHMFLHKTTSLS